jgi:hypothetical protein
MIVSTVAVVVVGAEGILFESLVRGAGSLPNKSTSDGLYSIPCAFKFPFAASAYSL